MIQTELVQVVPQDQSSLRKRFLTILRFRVRRSEGAFTLGHLANDSLDDGHKMLLPLDDLLLIDAVDDSELVPPLVLFGVEDLLHLISWLSPVQRFKDLLVKV